MLSMIGVRNLYEVNESTSHQVLVNRGGIWDLKETVHAQRNAKLIFLKQILEIKCKENSYTQFELKSLNSVSTFSLFSQLKKWTQAAEQPIGFEYFWPSDIFLSWLATMY